MIAGEELQRKERMGGDVEKDYKTDKREGFRKVSAEQAGNQKIRNIFTTSVSTAGGGCLVNSRLTVD